MADETVQAESSAAATETPKFTQFNGWDEDGNPVVVKKEEPAKAAEKNTAPGKPEKAESAAADASKETKADDAADSAAKKTQEQKHRKPDAESRIRELTTKLKERERELEEARKPKETKTAETSPAKAAEQKPANAQPQNFQEWLKGFKSADFLKTYAKDHPEASYEDAQLAQTLHVADMRDQFRQREQQVAQQQQTLNQHLEEARGRYTDFDTVTKPLISDMLKPDVRPEVFAVINNSPVLADLLYTIGSADATRTEFLEACRTDPGKALRVALLMEQEIMAELGKGKGAAERGEDGKFKAKGESEATPAAPKPKAPKPPTEVGGRGAPGEDAAVSAAKAGNFRQFEAEQNRRALASRK